MKSLKLFIYEHVSGGGYVGQHIPSSILSEGYGMLRTLISDLKIAGHTVTTSLDSRILKFNPPLSADEIVPISSRQEQKKTFEKTSQCADAIYIIAPESNGVLQRLVEIVEVAGGVSLNCSADSVRIASNKARFYEILGKVGLPAAETIVIDIREGVKLIEHATRELGFPLVFKPIDGVGGCGLSIVRDKNQISMAIDKAMNESSSKYIIAQRLIKGIAASVSLISTGQDALPLTLNKQRVTLASPTSNSSYHGGTVPIDHSSKDRALRTAREVVKSLRGLRGYVGVDMVLTDDGPIIMEVNPRLTTSYIGLRHIMNFNLAHAIIHAVLERKLPKDLQVSGYAIFSKINVPAPIYESLQRTYKLKELVSPPFPIGDEGTAYGLIVASSAKLSDVRKRLYRTKRHLLNVIGGG